MIGEKLCSGKSLEVYAPIDVLAETLYLLFSCLKSIALHEV